MDCIKTICSNCGADALWEEELGPKPLCQACWDAEVERTEDVRYSGRAWQLKYYASHIEANRAGCRRYRRTHRDELNAYHRKYCSTRRELIARRQREYYERNHSAELLRASWYRLACREGLRGHKIDFRES